MKDAAFQELLTSVRQFGQIRRGTRRASRKSTFLPSNVQAVRAALGASQAEFALMIGISVATLRNWEQGRRAPEGMTESCCQPIRTACPDKCPDSPRVCCGQHLSGRGVRLDVRIDSGPTAAQAYPDRMSGCVPEYASGSRASLQQILG
jgi:putative transcriptional regulator